MYESREEKSHEKKTQIRQILSRFLRNDESVAEVLPLEKDLSDTYEIERSGFCLFKFPALFEQDHRKSLVLGQPKEIVQLIGRNLTPTDLARAMGVSKAWYREFGRESLWRPHLAHHSLNHRPAKVEVAYQNILKQIWMRGEVLPRTVHVTYRRGVVAPDGSWVMFFDSKKCHIWANVRNQLKDWKVDNPHGFSAVNGGMFSPDGRTLYTYGDGGHVGRWTGFERRQISGKLFTTRRTDIPHSLQRQMNPHESHLVYGGVLSRDGTWGLTFGTKGRIVHWSCLDSEEPVGVAIAAPDIGVVPIVACITGGDIAPDGSWAINVGQCGIAVYWRGFQNGNIVGTLLKEPILKEYPMSDCLISKNGTSATMVGSKGKVLKWKGFENESPELDSSISDLPHEEEKIRRIFRSPDDSWIVTIDPSRVVLSRDLEGESPSFSVITTPSTEAFLISPNYRWAISLSGDTAKFWDPHVSIKLTTHPRKARKVLEQNTVTDQ